jgi:hypothetical protein
MAAKIQCVNCGRLVDGNPRIKNQQYCNEKDCQRARKLKWQKEKLASDPDYQANQRASQIDWHKRNPDFYKEYRRKHPDYRRRNTLFQRCRKARACAIATMDALEPDPAYKPRVFCLFPLVATMDASAQKVLLFSMRYAADDPIAKEDSIGFQVAPC